MALNVNKLPKGKGKFVEQPVIEPGTYPARTVQIVDLGLQPQRPYQGQEKPPAYEVMFTYELVDTFMVDEAGNELEDKPRWVNETFPLRRLDSDLAKSTKRYRALDPEEAFEGDFSKLGDLPCNVTLVNNKSGDRVYTNVANVATMRARDAAKCPELKNDLKIFALDEPDINIFLSFPEWLQEKIKGNLEYNGSVLQKALANGQPKEDEAGGDEGQEDEADEEMDQNDNW